jgi:outer membrane protein assembly factor BamB
VRKAFSTPIPFEAAGRRQVISSGANATMAYDAASGEEIWRVRYRGFSMSSRPVRHGQLVLINTGFMRAQLWA